MANSYSGVSTAGEFVALPEAILSVYSLDILHAAQGVMRYEEFGVPKTELGTAPGQTIVFTQYNDITRGSALSEHVEMATKNMSAAQKSITVGEWGNAIGVSEKLLQVSFDNQMAEAALLLGRDYSVVRDISIRDVIVGSGSTMFTTPGAAAVGDVLDTDTFDIETLRLAIEQLQTANAPKFFNDFYVCFVHPHQSAYLRRDPDWISAQMYGNMARGLFNGEIGRWEDVVFITTTHQQNGAAAVTDPGYLAGLAGTGHDGQNLYKATLMADQAYGIADGLPVEMRDDGVHDFGRKHMLGWYGIWGTGILNSTYLIHIISS